MKTDLQELIPGMAGRWRAGSSRYLLKLTVALAAVFVVCLPRAGQGAESAPYDQAQWIWGKVERPDPFQFVRFQKGFELDAAPEKAQVFITSDTFYRLRLNGQLVMHGPARTSAGTATLDVVDATPYLQAGRNRIEVEAFYGNCRYEALAQAPGMICALDIKSDGRDLVVTTDSSWQFAEVPAWNRQSPQFSYQRAWVQDYDARLDARPDWQPVVVLGPVGTAPWKTLQVRDIPLPNPRYSIQPESVVAVQRGDGEMGDGKAGGFGNPPNWLQRLEREGVKTDASAAANPEGITMRGKDDTVLEGNHAEVTYDFGADYVGFVGFEVSGDAGETLELAWNERLSDYGGTARPGERLTANLALRYVLRDGRQTFLAFTPQVIRYLRIAHRGPGNVTVHRLWLADYGFALAPTGDFSCSDDGLNRVYAAARRTAQMNTLDTFMDNPSRERGSWFREAYWTAQAIYAAFGDTSVSRRMVRYGAASQDHPNQDGGPDGMVQMIYPARFLHPGFIPAHALYWSLQLGLHQRWGVDSEFVRELLPANRRLFKAFETWLDPEGLLENVKSWNFLDWTEIKDGPVSVGLNGMYAAALDDSARLERQFGESTLAEHYEQLAQKVRQALNQYCGEGPFYPDTLQRNAQNQIVPGPGLSEGVQLFLMWAHVPSAERTRRLWERLRDPFVPIPGGSRAPIEGMVRGGMYCFFERLQIAARLDDYAALVRDAKAMFVPMADSPPGTLWETPWPELYSGSLSQGFASGIAAVLTEEILGLRLEWPLRITPHSGGVLRWCMGHGNTPNGRVDVAWSWKSDRYELQVTPPAGMDAKVELPDEAKAVWASGPSQAAWQGQLTITGPTLIEIDPGTIHVKAP
ncbi:MAG: alpha-L-rhamnosidase N-terminal domain-containing protein [Candidatus Omnitrophica bacterium]|nr:alpha-L-rhamnosidase N-terminal domain-containing protein [Candidatus Omnitrophota bacterium]